MFEDVKLALRISNSAFDQEIVDLIESARMDLIISGVSPLMANSDTDPLIKRAIIIYCKSSFGYENADAERLNKSYMMLKQHLSLAGDYNGSMA